MTHHEIRIALGEIYTSGVEISSLMKRFQKHTGGQGHRNLGNCQRASPVSHGPAKQQSSTHPSVRGQSHGGLTETRESRVIRGEKGTTSRGHWETWSILYLDLDSFPEYRHASASYVSVFYRTCFGLQRPDSIYKGSGAPKNNGTMFASIDILIAFCVN